MARSKSSARWLREHFDDPYVKQAKAQGYRSRAVFKLMEIQQRDRLLKPGMTVVDLGAAPGGWSQYAAEQVGDRGQVIALDLLAMTPPPGVIFIQGDFREQSVMDQLLETLADRPVDLVMSDMAPNISGVKAADQIRGMYLAELACDFAERSLKPGGDLVMKVFQGQGFDALLKTLKAGFKTVVTRKPESSRARSAETYLLAKNYRL